MLPKHLEELADALDGLYGAFGILADRGRRDPFRRMVSSTLEEFETAFCLADWRAYRAWARRFSQAYDCAVAPCDAWFEAAPTAEPWIDETAEEMARFFAEVHKDERKDRGDR